MPPRLIMSEAVHFGGRELGGDGGGLLADGRVGCHLRHGALKSSRLPVGDEFPQRFSHEAVQVAGGLRGRQGEDLFYELAWEGDAAPHSVCFIRWHRFTPAYTQNITHLTHHGAVG